MLIKSGRAQVALEYLLLIGIVIAVTVPFFYYASTTMTQNIKMNEAATAVNKIVETADFLYALGPGSQEEILVKFPKGTKLIVIEGKEIILKLEIFEDVSDVVGYSKANMEGDLIAKSGPWHIILENEDNTIQISNKY
jgi:uncharacterized protein (UPF0333 family)